GELAGRKDHVVHGMWTPSGYFHIGNARNELMAPLLVHDALRDSGKKVSFNFFVDDFDDLDKIPEDIVVPKGFEENLGKFLHIAPSPAAGYESWSDYFSSAVLETMDKFGAHPKIHSSYREYKKGSYDNAIRTVLDNWQKVRDLWVKIT